MWISVDPLNFRIGHYRTTTLPLDGVALRIKPSVICYFTYPGTAFTATNTAGEMVMSQHPGFQDACLRTSLYANLHKAYDAVIRLSLLRSADLARKR